MLLGFVELAAVEVQPRYVEVADRFLRQLLIRLILAKDPFEPAKRFAEVPAKAGGQCEIMGYQPYVLIVRKFFCQLERDSELLLGFGPLSEDGQTKPAGIGALHESLGRLWYERFGPLEQLERFRVTPPPACTARERIQSS